MEANRTISQQHSIWLSTMSWSWNHAADAQNLTIQFGNVIDIILTRSHFLMVAQKVASAANLDQDISSSRKLDWYLSRSARNKQDACDISKTQEYDQTRNSWLLFVRINVIDMLCFAGLDSQWIVTCPAKLASSLWHPQFGMHPQLGVWIWHPQCAAWSWHSQLGILDLACTLNLACEFGILNLPR